MACIRIGGPQISDQEIDLLNGNIIRISLRKRTIRTTMNNKKYWREVWCPILYTATGMVSDFQQSSCDYYLLKKTVFYLIPCAMGISRLPVVRARWLYVFELSDVHFLLETSWV